MLEFISPALRKCAEAHQSKKKETNIFGEKFTYDISKKGALNSLSDDTIFPVTIFANFRYYFLSSSAITSITVSNNGASVVYAAQNTYDSDGFLKSTIMKSGTDELFRVDYKYFEK